MFRPKLRNYLTTLKIGYISELLVTELQASSHTVRLVFTGIPPALLLDGFCRNLSKAYYELEIRCW